MADFTGKSFSFLGRSGSGKGTQFDLFQEKLEKEKHDVYRHISGAVFRTLSKKDTLAGKRIKEILERGGLMPDWLASFTWEKRLIEELESIESVILFDGSPRRLEEAMLIDEVLEWLKRKPLIPLHIEVPREEAFQRLKLRGRDDDTDDAINARLAWFDEDVMPILDYYQQQKRLITVSGIGTEEEVFKRILSALSSVKP